MIALRLRYPVTPKTSMFDKKRKEIPLEPGALCSLHSNTNLLISSKEISCSKIKLDSLFSYSDSSHKYLSRETNLSSVVPSILLSNLKYVLLCH
jgi:hypothetical protein